MGEPGSPLHVAVVAGALLWPLAAGVAVVAWSKARAGARARRLTDLDGQLRSAYRTLEFRPVPPQLTMVVDALQEGHDLAGGAARAKATTSAGS